MHADSKKKGGIIGISQSPAALERSWFLTSHERASVTTALKDMYAIRDGDRLGTHKEAAPKRVKRDESDVQKLVNCFTSGLMTNPFTQETDSLVNFATGGVLPADIAKNLVDSSDKGCTQMNTTTIQATPRLFADDTNITAAR